MDAELPPMKMAKTMTGHIYSYPVTTCHEFLECLSKESGLPVGCIRLLDPDSDTKEEAEEEAAKEEAKKDTKEEAKKDDNMKEDTLYYLFVDDRFTCLLSWIHPHQLNPHLRIDNPSVPLTEEDKRHYGAHQLDYCAFYPHLLSVVEEYIHDLNPRGWMRLFGNEAAVPLMTANIDKVKEHFYKHAYLLARNEEAIPLLEQLLSEGTAIQYPDKFWFNLSSNPKAVPLLLHYPDQTEYDGLCSNPSLDAIKIIEERLDREPAFISQLHWGILSSNESALHLLHRYPEYVDQCSVFYQRNPAMIEWCRLYVQPDTIRWKQLCRYTDPAFIAFIEEHFEFIQPAHWAVLSQNEAAIPLLKRHPDKIHWGTFCYNPSPHVITMLEERLQDTENPNPLVPSEDGVSTIGDAYRRFHHIESYQGKEIVDIAFQYTINCGMLSLHPHALPFLEYHPEFIFWNSLSLHPGIYQKATDGRLL